MAFTEQQLKDAARKAIAAGDVAAAKRLIDAARQAGAGISKPSVEQATPAMAEPTTQALPQATPRTPAPFSQRDFANSLTDADKREMDKTANPYTQEDTVYDPMTGFPIGGGFMNTPQQTPLTAGQSFGLGLGNAMAFGFGDEINAGIEAALTGKTYAEAYEPWKGIIKDAKASGGYGVGQVAGGAALPAKLGPALIAAMPTTLTKMFAGAGAGGILGQVTGMGDAEGDLADRAVDAIPSALFGAGIGAAIPGLGGVAKSIFDRGVNKEMRGLAATAPTIDELAIRAGEIYKKADQVAPLPRAALTSEAGGIIGGAERMGLDEMLTPTASRVIGKIEEAATSPNPFISFQDLDILRRQAGIPAGDIANRTQAAIGARAVDGLDRVLEKAAPDLSEEVNAARKMWSMMRRSEVLEEISSRAALHPSGYAQGLLTEVRSLLKNPKKLRGFSPDEVGELKNMITKNSPQSLMSIVGKLAPRGVGNGNILGSAISSGGGYAVGGLPGAIVAPALANVARTIGDALAERGLREVQGLVASGGNLALKRMKPETLNIINSLLARGGRGAISAQE